MWIVIVIKGVFNNVSEGCKLVILIGRRLKEAKMFYLTDFFPSIFTHLFSIFHISNKTFSNDIKVLFSNLFFENNFAQYHHAPLFSWPIKSFVERCYLAEKGCHFKLFSQKNLSFQKLFGQNSQTWKLQLKLTRLFLQQKKNWKLLKGKKGNENYRLLYTITVIWCNVEALLCNFQFDSLLEWHEA